jgi:predicted 3-demethylubiquinone-9 3-methyltransferase (glyoxalase superfamily)
VQAIRTCLMFVGEQHGRAREATSQFVDCDRRDELDTLHSKLLEGGVELMPLAEYPFSPRFGWVQDRFGVSWQLNLVAG